MRLNEVVFTDAKPVESYGPGFFRIGGDVVHGAMLVGPGGVQSWAGYDDPDAVSVLAGDVDVVFVGTGADVAHLPETFRDQLEAVGLGVEAMSSPAACRTYNVLLSEGRRIALAVLPV